MNQRVLGTLATFVLAVSSTALAQNPAPPGANAVRNTNATPAAAPAAPPKPTPRRANGKPILGTVPGETALWLPGGGGGERFVAADTADPTPGKLRESEIPFQPWARAMWDHRVANQLEPHTRCHPSGGPRIYLTPYGVEIVELPEAQMILIMDLGGPHTYRIIHMDGKPHPAEITPSAYGHAIGKWEGDTLVIDSVGFNEKFWLDRQGTPHTDRLHMIEKLTRTDYNTIKYDVTIEDPGAYTKTWTSGFNLRWVANSELFEYVCQDNNFASDLMVGTQESVDRTSKIVP